MAEADFESWSAYDVFYLTMGIIVMFLILGGNSITVFSILKNPHLATPSNQFILGLACADLLVIIVYSIY